MFFRSFLRNGRSIIGLGPVAWTYPSKKSLEAIKHKIKSLTTKSTTHLSLKVLLIRINPVLRGWAAHFRYDAGKRTLGYVGHYTWWRVYRWLRKKHPKRTWRYLRDRYCGGQWNFQDQGIELFRPSQVKVERYRYRGQRILLPWMEPEELGQVGRYANDCNICVRSERAGHRVMECVSNFITGKLKLKVNQSKSRIGRPWECKFLGFRIIAGRKTKRSIAPVVLARFKDRVRELTRRTRGVTIQQMIEQLNLYLIGWRGCFGFCETPSVLKQLDSWIRRRLRSVVWKQWKRGKKRFAKLRKRGVNKDLAAQTVGSAHGPWRISRSPALSYALPDAYFDTLGLAKLINRLNA